IAMKYKGSIVGMVWAFVVPLLLLAIYTFVFTVVFKARWITESDGNETSFAVVLFSGMIYHSLFADILNRAPVLIVNNPNFVKKVIFPLETLPITLVLSSAFYFLMAFLALTGASFWLNGALH